MGWGALPYFSEFDRFGQLVFNAEFPAGVNTYRAYLLPWDPDRPGFPRPWQAEMKIGTGTGRD